MTAVYQRYALYAVPPAESVLWLRGCAWLGRDPAGSAPPPRPPFAAELDERWAELTAEPRRYGFHGTLKPPFALAAGRDRQQLEAAIEDFAAARPASGPVALRAAALSGFLALVPAEPMAALTALAAAAVERLDGFRAPTDPADLARRRQARLSPAQDANLLRWGYPYVFDEFRFHMTLSRRLSPAEAAQLRPALEAWFAPALLAPQPLELALFGEPAAGAAFDLLRRFALSG